MTVVQYDNTITDDIRRQRLFEGDVFVSAPTKTSLAFIEFVRDYLQAAFSPYDPQTAQRNMSVEDYASLLSTIKPAFIHHEECKRLIPGMLRELGCDPKQTYFDVPRLRTSTCDNFLTTGIAYAFHPHRDTWYSAPMCQINWWLPVYPVSATNAMTFHGGYWNKSIKNSSEIYNYQEWNKHNRFSAAKHVGKDDRPQPKALEPIEEGQEVTVLPAVGSALIFSAAHLHSSIPNTSEVTRLSVDFRTVHIGDVSEMRGAPNMDSRCTGTTMGDYLSCFDLSHLPDSVTLAYANGPVPAIG